MPHDTGWNPRFATRRSIRSSGRLWRTSSCPRLIGPTLNGEDGCIRIGGCQCAISSSSGRDLRVCPRRLPRSAAISTTRCSSRACWSIRFRAFRRRWCSSRRRSCSRSAACRSSRRTRSRRASKRSAITGTWSTPSICRLPSTKRCVSRFRPSTARDRRGADEPMVFALETRSSRGVRRVRHARKVILAIGYYDQPNMLSVPGEDLPHVQPLLQRAAPLLSPARGRSSAAATRRRNRRSSVSRRRARHAGAPGAGAEVDDQVLGASGHREPDQGRIDRGAVQHLREGDSADVGRRDDRDRRRPPRGGAARRRGVPADGLSRRLGSDGARGRSS